MEKKIYVVYGGTSSEREVSLQSGSAIYEALKQYGYRDVTLFDLREDNIAELIAAKPDIAFLALHGKGGEDGCIQGALELAHIPYTGSGVASSAICMNKVFTKQVLEAAGLPTAKYIELRREYDYDAVCRRLLQEIGLPMVLKSPCQGSSLGVVIVHKEEELRGAVEEIYRYGEQLMAEKFLSGVEVTLPIIGNEEICVLPDIEITSENEFFDYEAKYTEGMCHHIIPARIGEEDRARIVEIGKRAYAELDCCGLARIDFIVDRDEGPVIIEVNTLPGMTAMSLVPDAARAMGISFDKLCAKILEYGFAAKRALF